MKEPKEVRLVGDNIEPGIYSFSAAQNLASELGLDLVQVSDEKIYPPVYRILDKKKYEYDQAKKKKANKQGRNDLKEVGFTPNISSNDYQTKLNQCIKFLEKGMKVRAYVFFKGRTIIHPEFGEELLNGLISDLCEYGKPGTMPKDIEGRKLMITFSPIKKK